MNIEGLKGLILQDMKNKAQSYQARSYFYNKQAPKHQDFYVNGKFTSTTSKSSLNINLLKQLIMQKIDYILSKELTVSNNIFNWDSLFSEMIQNASLDSKCWLHIYINRGKLDYLIINDTEIIPIWDNNGKNILQLVRYFKIEDGYSVELWNAKEILYFKMKNEVLTPLEKRAHYSDITMYNGEVEEIKEQTFSTIPFFPLFNNRNIESDAEDILDLLDMYNSICTGFIQNIDLFQEAIVKLKNFSGDGESLKEALRMMKETKAVGLPQDGDIDYLKIEIPVEARQVILELIKDAIYSLGRGVDVDKMIGAGNVTNVYIKSRYQALDFKANDTILQCKIFYSKVIEFVNSFYNRNLNDKIDFNKTLIVNEAEQMDTCIKAITLLDEGLISKETIMKNIPWVSNIKDEKKLIAKEEAEEPKQDNVEVINNDVNE